MITEQSINSTWPSMCIYHDHCPARQYWTSHVGESSEFAFNLWVWWTNSSLYQSFWWIQLGISKVLIAMEIERRLEMVPSKGFIVYLISPLQKALLFDFTSFYCGGHTWQDSELTANRSALIWTKIPEGKKWRFKENPEDLRNTCNYWIWESFGYEWEILCLSR